MHKSLKSVCAGRASIALFLLLTSPISAAPSTAPPELTWNQLTALEGKYPFEPVVQAILKRPLQNLLQNKYPEFNRYYQVQTPIEIDQNVLLSSGMKPHEGGSYAAFVFFGKGGELLTVIKRKNKREYIGNQKLRQHLAVRTYLKRFDHSKESESCSNC